MKKIGFRMPVAVVGCKDHWKAIWKMMFRLQSFVSLMRAEQVCLHIVNATCIVRVFTYRINHYIRIRFADTTNFEGAESDTFKWYFQAGAFQVVLFVFPFYWKCNSNHLCVCIWCYCGSVAFPHSLFPRSLFVQFCFFSLQNTTHGRLLTALDNLLIMRSCVVDAIFSTATYLDFFSW